MAKKKRLRILLLALCLLIMLPGCGSCGKTKTSGGTGSGGKGGNTGTVSEAPGGGGEQSDGENGEGGDGYVDDEDGGGDGDDYYDDGGDYSDDGNGGDGEEQEDDTEEETVRREYEAAVEDPSRIKGKLAAYYVGGSFNYTDNSQSSPQDVVSGESTLLVAPDGTTMLFDFNSDTGNAGYLVKLMKRLGITKIDYAVVTTVNAAHLGGFLAVNNSVPVGELYISPHDFTGNMYYDRIVAAKVKIHQAKAGDTIPFGGGVTVKVLSPDKDYNKWSDSNGIGDGSLVVKVTYNKSSFLFGGYISNDFDKTLVNKYKNGELQADIVRMNRQGAGSSDSKKWIEAVKPKIAVCVGSGAAKEEVFNRYLLVADTVLQTAVDGVCLIYTSGDGTYDVQVEMRRTNNAFGTLTTDNGHFTVK